MTMMAVTATVTAAMWAAAANGIMWNMQAVMRYMTQAIDDMVNMQAVKMERIAMAMQGVAVHMVKAVARMMAAATAIRRDQISAAVERRQGIFLTREKDHHQPCSEGEK